VTGSMQRAIDETNRRRDKQQEFNKEHGITPKGIKKSVEDILESAHTPGKARSIPAMIAENNEQQKSYMRATPRELGKMIKELEEKMYKAAKALDFEEAARYRDEITRLNDSLMQ